MPFVLATDTKTRRLRGDFIPQSFPLPYSSLAPLPIVPATDTKTRRLRGEFISQSFPLPYSSLAPLPVSPVIAAKQLSGDYVDAIWQEPPYRQGIGLDVGGAVDWVKQNPLIFGVIAIGAVLALKGRRRR